ncbi:MAG: hypothetical protein PHG32_03020 [Candidatus Cloacimonetes bacterium]|nr:hypothetical protein [Candidatus Cloacimonadota bacterium]
MSEQDKLSGERKLVELLVNKYSGKARHSPDEHEPHEEALVQGMCGIADREEGDNCGG